MQRWCFMVNIEMTHQCSLISIFKRERVQLVAGNTLPKIYKQSGTPLLNSSTDLPVSSTSLFLTSPNKFYKNRITQKWRERGGTWVRWGRVCLSLWGLSFIYIGWDKTRDEGTRKQQEGSWEGEEFSNKVVGAAAVMHHESAFSHWLLSRGTPIMLWVLWKSTIWPQRDRV
jgi:hypothetical protein